MCQAIKILKLVLTNLRTCVQEFFDLSMYDSVKKIEDTTNFVSKFNFSDTTNPCTFNPDSMKKETRLKIF